MKDGLILGLELGLAGGDHGQVPSQKCRGKHIDSSCISIRLSLSQPKIGRKVARIKECADSGRA